MATTTPETPAAKAQRKTRPTPERTAPVRQMLGKRSAPAKSGTAERPPVETASLNGPAPAAKAAPHTPPEGPEHRAVRTGYELSEAAIQRGQEAARRLAPAAFEAMGLKEVPGAKEAIGVAEGAVRVFAELATAWVRAVFPNGSGGLPDPLRFFSTLREAMTGQAPSGSASTAAHAMSFAVEVHCGRHVRIALELSRDIAASDVAVQALQPVDRDPGKPLITTADLRPSKDGRSIEAHLSVPPSQPKGRYLGAVYDKESGAFVGGLTVDVRD